MTATAYQLAQVETKNVWGGCEEKNSNAVFRMIFLNRQENSRSGSSIFDKQEPVTDASEQICSL